MSDEHPGTDETQPIAGPPTPPGDEPPPTTPYGTSPGPGAVPPPQNPYAAPQNPYGAPPPQSPYQPPPNPYPQPGSFDQSTAPGPYGSQTYGAYPGGYGAGLPDHPSATTAMVLGIIGLVGVVLCQILLVLSPFAWAMGSRAVKEIDAQPGRYAGRDRANAGRIMGIIGTVLLVLGLVAIVVFVVLVYSVGNDGMYSQSPTNG